MIFFSVETKWVGCLIRSLYNKKYQKWYQNPLSEKKNGWTTTPTINWLLNMKTLWYAGLKCFFHQDWLLFFHFEILYRFVSDIAGLCVWMICWGHWCMQFTVKHNHKYQLKAVWFAKVPDHLVYVIIKRWTYPSGKFHMTLMLHWLMIKFRKFVSLLDTINNR